MFVTVNTKSKTYLMKKKIVLKFKGRLTVTGQALYPNCMLSRERQYLVCILWYCDVCVLSSDALRLGKRVWPKATVCRDAVCRGSLVQFSRRHDLRPPVAFAFIYKLSVTAITLIKCLQLVLHSNLKFIGK